MSSEYKQDIKELLSFVEYSLKSGVFLVEGFSRCALYDINSGNVYSLDKNAQDVLTGRSKNTNFWKKLVSMGLCTDKNHLEKQILSELEYKPSLQFA
ncbi:hypothetical protein A2130_00555 [Candidatus Woesebacteria bacterium GWC2_33_12]|uniref:Uncharacterized protein n=1 Tax=Candidatus Woesebacteria bacterium GW2011_GWB1_33_22 TaxID=1618566 RepID=A0A0G0CPB1_9BACT|nr:MAG: hypothetical protein UR29_C0002G0002 [Candidatus Woesebacteria bacterium GW2011_GWC2_33_12]KKP42474.1 MAG: hypothetical protein UR33_C0002G0050 [Candidatus Woesebacteria bacterium GW2011_GWA2_33_20]KKP45217.1 MAG: hypothetical protein UR35_C0002G0050 [Candidatus Woesebacteria bacterium GW2011_GWB1_33_22]KKP46488.1 MAG: hypothetical protein UR37_C0007G0045 [Microgenomates group bacterium GW2011_GWC1_33_28]KKP50887.1 MAG: hypothetical protein UR41_C0002G0051 [Candidatus Woesebacteria bact